MHELVLRTEGALVELLSDTLIDELDALSVSLEDANAHDSAEVAIFGEPGIPAARNGWPSSIVRALFADERLATEAALLLLARRWDGPVELQSMQEVPDQDWVRLTQSQFGPVEITPSFWIVPSWHEPPDVARRVIRLDPGLAFGTGTHPTTRMCLGWLARHAQAWPRVLDYGCGSGILAIGALLHGACAVDAVDIDDTAIEATRINAQANGVRLQAGRPDLAQGQYDLVVANILAKPLTLLAPLLASHLGRPADLVLAGILERQASELRAAYAPWCGLEVLDEQEGWILMGAHVT
jgi:ribosomal protein L11 methyltransferase